MCFYSYNNDLPEINHTRKVTDNPIIRSVIIKKQKPKNIISGVIVVADLGKISKNIAYQ